MWTTTPTLGLCSACEDATSELVKNFTDKSFEIVLSPNGGFVTTNLTVELLKNGSGGSYPVVLREGTSPTYTRAREILESWSFLF